MADSTRDLKEIARSAPNDRPVSWGDIEAQILSLPVSPDDAARADEMRHPMNAAALGAILLAVYVLPALATIGLVAWATQLPEAPSWFATITGGAFIVAGIGMLIPTLTSEAGRRDRGSLRVTALAVVITAAAAGLLLADGLSPAWLSWLAVAVVLSGIVSIALLVRMQRTHPHSRLDRNTLSPEDKWRYDARAYVLDQLLRLGRVSERDIDRYAMVEMPLGSWAQFDTTTGNG
ncbi:hypothetical protein [Brevibacterium sp. 2SA]|uniref:hypothetical protein n=1 Tax=Brevibacterium sp. 2SA TaxID=2502198 RepID=UPI0010F7D5CB|nr:hypothetical protein [Brevibacterium sp. 2SA]